MSLPDDDWLRARLPDHISGAHADNAIADLRQPSSLLRAMFDAGMKWRSEEPIAAEQDEIEPGDHDTDRPHEASER